jgi:hypothetical protein
MNKGVEELGEVLPVLLGLGYRTFSVDVAHAPCLARTAGVRRRSPG